MTMPNQNLLQLAFPNTHLKVRCGYCLWLGNRSAVTRNGDMRDPLTRPCPRCGNPVVLDMGGVYLLHLIDPDTGKHAPYKHARHYIGHAQDLAWRFRYHQAGNGAVFTMRMVEAGRGLVIARTWPRMDKNFERKLKNGRRAPRLCPLCRNDVTIKVPEERRDLSWMN